MNIKVVGVTACLAAGLVLGSASFSPANAYGVTADGAITLNARDRGRKLDAMHWLVPAGTGTLPQDLSATAVVTVLDFQANFLDLQFNLKNTTANTFKASILGLGLGIDPDATSVSISNGATFDSATLLDKTFPGGFKGIDICAFAANNCQGGKVDDGLLNGESDIFTLRIGNSNGSFANGVTLTSYPIKFQTAYDSYQAAGVPEPITIVGSGLALGFGALLKREASKKTRKTKAKV